MKNFKLFLAACLLGLATAANAQFANSSAASVSENNDAWDGIRVSYNLFAIEDDNIDEDLDKIGAFEIGHVKAFSISSTTPLFLETGASLLWASGDLFDKYDLKISAELMSINIPVNLAYKFDIKEGMSIVPYAGLLLRYNISGEMEYDMTAYGEGKAKLDMFDEDEGDGDRIQYGLQIGARLDFNKFNVGVSYGFDINEIMDDTKTNKIAFTVGFAL